MRDGRLTLSMREAAARLKQRGIEMSKSELHRRMPDLVSAGIIKGARAPGRTQSVWQITPDEVEAMAEYFHAR
jgi:hypothetical protein